MRAYLIINTLFKTVEYKIDSLRNLKVTEFSLFGIDSKQVSLNHLEAKEQVSTTSFLSWAILIVGIIAIASTFAFKDTSTLISNNVMNIIFFIVTMCGSAFLICKPEKYVKYIDSSTQKVILKLSEKSISNHAAEKFLNELNNSIRQEPASEIDNIDLTINARREFEKHDRNVSDLFNSGMIDEALYDQICHSMHESIFGKKKKELIRNDNVIYLNQ